MINVHPIPAFTDNYIWCLHDQVTATVVDPGDANPVLDFLNQRGLALSTILITHHHADHIGGLAKLVQQFPQVRVIGPKTQRIPHLTEQVSDGDKVNLPELSIDLTVMEVPAHTLDHIAYYGEVGLFCGDTLFSGGCGRLFEGTSQQMMLNFERFAELPDATKIYCTHEYTMANNIFARAILPEDADFLEHDREIRSLRNNDTPTLPTSVGKEKKVNPYMRVSEPEMRTAMEKHTNSRLSSPLEVFSAIRDWKDRF